MNNTVAFKFFQMALKTCKMLSNRRLNGDFLPKKHKNRPAAGRLIHLRPPWPPAL